MKVRSKGLGGVVSLMFAAASLSSLQGCGGGNDEARPSASPQDAGATVERREALADHAEGRRDGAGLERKARAYLRKGITSLVVSPDGNSVAVAGSDGRLRLFDAERGELTLTLRGHTGAAATGLLFSADGRRLVSVGRDSLVRVWDAASGALAATLQAHEQPIRALASGADGRLVASAGEETRVMLWDGNSGRLKQVLSGPGDFVNAVAVSPNGALVASGDAQGRICVWQAAGGKLLHVLRGHAGEINALAFSPDGSGLASAGDSRVLLWDAAAGRQIGSLAGASSTATTTAATTASTAPRTTNAPGLTALAFSADGSLLAAGGDDGMALVWSLASRQLVHSLGGSGGAVNAIGFALKSQNLLFTGNEDNRVTLWNLERAAPVWR